MGNFYGHHPSQDVGDPNDRYTKDEVYTKEETETLILAVSANLDEHSELKGLTIGDDHTQYHNNTRGDARYYQQGQVDLLTEQASANAYNQAENSVLNNPDWNNQWYKDFAYFTTITSAGPSAAIQVPLIPGNTLVRANIIGVSIPDNAKQGAYTLQAFFVMPGIGPPGSKLGSTTVLFEQESDTNWFADIDIDGSGIYAEVLVQASLTDWIITVEWLMLPALPP